MNITARSKPGVFGTPSEYLRKTIISFTAPSQALPQPKLWNRTKKSILLVLTIFQATIAARAADEFVAGELLVGFQPGTRGVQADAIRNGLGANKLRAWPGSPARL